MNDLQIGERVRYIGTRSTYYGKVGTVIHKTKSNTVWQPNQWSDTHVPVQFDDYGETYGAYRKWLERVVELPSWEV